MQNVVLENAMVLCIYSSLQKNKQDIFDKKNHLIGLHTSGHCYGLSFLLFFSLLLFQRSVQTLDLLLHETN